MRDSLNRRRQKWFKIATILLPVLVLVTCELVLHLAGYGGDRRLFQPSVSAPGYLRINPDAGLRYFANLQVSPETANDLFSQNKPADTYRLFVMGGSTAYGYPYGHNGSFAKMLYQRLKMVFPDHDVEVVNLGMTAINSYSILDMLPEVLAQEPDALVIYTGHNEYYGALGAASVESLGRSRSLIKLNLALQNLRSFLLLRRAIRRVSGFLRDNPQHSLQDATLMERMVAGRKIPIDSGLYAAGVRQFRENLKEIAQAAGKGGVPVLFCTLASNLRDQKPFVSPPLGSLDDVAAKKLELARTLHSLQKFEDAASVYHELVADHANHAQLYFEQGRNLLALGRRDEATAALRQAKDHDWLRFRAPSVFNQIIRDITSGTGHHLVDIESAFFAATNRSAPGSELFLDHLHPSLEGYFLMAREIAAAMRRTGQMANAWPESDPDLETRLWGQVAVTELDREVARIRIDRLTRRWPFTDREGSEAEPPKPVNRVQELAADLWRGKLTWEQAHVKAANHFGENGDFHHSAREYEALILETPRNVSPYLRAGLAYSQIPDFAAARHNLNLSLTIAETAQAHKILGAIDLKESNPDAALGHLQRANRLAPNDPQVLYNLTAGHLMRGEPEAAQKVLARLEAMQPRMQSLAALKQGIIAARAMPRPSQNQ